MTTFSVSTDKNLDRALLVLRIAVGAIFIMHGYLKVFGFGISGVTGMFTQIGIPWAGVVAPFISVLELVGGIALLLGVFTRIAAVLIACDVLGAVIFVHGKNGFFLPKGFEFMLANIAILVAVALLGAGAFSVDAAMARKGSGTS